MDAQAQHGDSFAIKDLWQTSSLADFNQHPTTDLTLGLDLSNLDLGHGDESGMPKSIDLQLPDLSTFQFGPVEDVGTLDTEFSISSSTEPAEVAGALDDDVWSLLKSVEGEPKFARLKSWETFYDKSFQEPRAVYISEGGPRVIDAVFATDEGRHSDAPPQRPSAVFRSDPLLANLLQLGLGRESVLYRYSVENNSFCALIERSRMSGYSHEAFQSLTSFLIDTGNKFRRLRFYVENTQTSPGSSPSLVALASSLSDILVRLQSEVGDPSQPVRTLLQLRSLFEHPASILSWLTDLIAIIQNATTDEEVITRLYGIAENAESSAPWLQQLSRKLMASVCRPWLECMCGWLLLELEQDSRIRCQAQLPSFVKSMEETRRCEGRREVKLSTYEYEASKMPSFIATEDAQVIFDTGQSLRLLEAHQPEHPLLKPKAVNCSGLRGLEWQFSWRDVEKIQSQAEEYERNLQKAIRDFDSSGKRADLERRLPDNTNRIDHEPPGLSEDIAKAYINASVSVIEKPLILPGPPNGDPLSDAISQLSLKAHGTDALEVGIFAPPLSLLPVLSFNPLIFAQSKLTNRACLRLLFKDFDLKAHFSLLYRYSLFGDGVFASRLSHALFDPELQTAERRKGHSRAGTSGLRLGFRDTWPPASSELRLALMGILTDSWYLAIQMGNPSLFHGELPGGLSFSIREMSEDELQRCTDPDSIKALDFLKLEYRPPSPLDSVITQASLLKYDAIFKLLLKALRMLFAVNQLFRDIKTWSTVGKSVDGPTQKFRVESQHFVSAVCAYFFDGIQANWKVFERRLEYMESTLDEKNCDSLSSLRGWHERTLDRTMFALILRRRQAQVMKLLEEIFSLVLQFTRHIRVHGAAPSAGVESERTAGMKAIHERFQKKVRVFISVCRGLSERRRQGRDVSQQAQGNPSMVDDASEDGANTMGHLLLKLEMSGFYALR